MAARSRNQLGPLALAVVCLACVVSLLLASAPSATVAHATARAAHQPASRPPQVLAYAAPAVARVLTYYYGTTRGGDLVPIPVACTGAGVLVGTTSDNSFNYLLTATSVVNPLTPCEGAQAAFQQLNGPAQGWGVLRIEVWLSEAYTGAAQQVLGTIRYKVDPSQITTAGGPYSPKLSMFVLAGAAGAPNHDLPVLQTPQPADPPAGPTQTVVDLGTLDGQPLGHDAIATSDAPDTLYPLAVDAAQLNQIVVPSPTRPPTSTPPQQTVVGGTAVPTHAPTVPPTFVTTPSTVSSQISLGAPVVDSNGALVGMVIPDSTGAHVIASLTDVQRAIGQVSGKPGPLMSHWKQGVTAFYAASPDFGGAVAAFSALVTTAPDFGGVTAYLNAAKARSTNVAVPGDTPTITPGPTSPGPSGGALGLPVVVAALGLVIFALLLALVLIFIRLLERRRGDVLPAPTRRERPRPSAPLLPSAWSPPPADTAPTEPQPSIFPTAARPSADALDVEKISTVVMPTVVASPPLSRGVNLIPQAAGLTDPGRKRAGEPNQDNVLAITGTFMSDGRAQHYGLFIVADGMGGHTNGREASRRTIEVMAGYIIPALTGGQATDSSALPALLKGGSMQANADLREQNLTKRADMGTTMTAALVVGDVAYVANVGDSRTYIMSPDRGLHKVTTDHSVVASLVSAGVIRPEDVYTHPRRNQIYRSLGGQHEDTDVDIFQVALEAGDRLLLCSDGLWEMVRDPQIESILSTSAEPNQAAQKLIDEANANGGEDNISVIVVRMLDEQASYQSQPGSRMVAGPQSMPLPGQA
ncbi:MAG TPA: protein phosphatase 2C domain-containing protein [Ktedonobacterales bacterium]